MMFIRAVGQFMLVAVLVAASAQAYGQSDDKITDSALIARLDDAAHSAYAAENAMDNGDSYARYDLGSAASALVLRRETNGDVARVQFNATAFGGRIVGQYFASIRNGFVTCISMNGEGAECKPILSDFALREYLSLQKCLENQGEIHDPGHFVGVQGGLPGETKTEFRWGQFAGYQYTNKCTFTVVGSAAYQNFEITLGPGERGAAPMLNRVRRK